MVFRQQGIVVILQGFQATWNVYNIIFIITWFEVTKNVHIHCILYDFKATGNCAE